MPVEIRSADAGRRVDVFLAEAAGLSRSRVQSMISEGLVLIDGVPVKKNHHMAAGETIEWTVPEKHPCGVEPEAIPLDVVYEDEHIVVVDKPAGMVMYPGPGHEGHTLSNALLARYPEVSEVGGEGRPGVFHRLDRDTSGLVAVARTEEAYLAMVDRISAREVERVYLALATGSIAAEQGTIDAPMDRSPHNRKKMAVVASGGREAVTRFKVLERYEGYTLLEVRLETGRTHQIRVHLSYIGHPVAGDPEYSRGRARKELGLERQFLHATRLSFMHPVTAERLEFSSELPEDLRTVLLDLNAT